MPNSDNLKWTNFSGSPKEKFRLQLIAIFLLIVVNIFYKISWSTQGLVAAFNLWNPLWLLFGPTLLFAQKALLVERIKKNLFFHLLPFAFFSVFFVYLWLMTDMSDPWANQWFTYYQNAYGIIAISLIGYSVRVLMKAFKHEATRMPYADSLVISLSIVYTLTGLVTVMMVISWRIIPMNAGFDYRYLTYGLLAFAMLMLVLYWFMGDKEEITAVTESADEEVSDKNNPRSALTDELARDYSQRITSYFESTQMYLDPNITIDLLSKELLIPKHDFSRLFNVYFEKNFHKLIAEYRIMHAISLIKQNSENLKIESLATSCGFNSKASFFKHFKEQTGLTPSEYRLKLGFNANP